MPFIFHSDGRLWEVMNDLIEVGINGLHPLEPKGMDAKEVKKRIGDKVCLLGNIDLDRLIRGSPEEIALMVKDRIKHLGSGGGYCLGSSNTVTESVPIDNYKTMIETTLKFGRYLG